MTTGSMATKRRGCRKNYCNAHLAKGGEVDRDVVNELTERSSNEAGVVTRMAGLTLDPQHEQETEKHIIVAFALISTIRESRVRGMLSKQPGRSRGLLGY